MEDKYAPIGKLLSALEKTGKKYDFDKIKKAYLHAAEFHEGQFRQSGEPFVYHPIAVAEIVATLELDTDSICAALLHDTVEDCGDKVDVGQIRREYGEEVAMLVDGLTKLVQIPFEDKEDEHVENLRKMFLAMSKDIRVIFIKLCDRLHNMRTLSAKRPEKQRVTALETMYVYAPLAHRLGMQRIKQELENISLSYLDPIGYSQVKTDIDKRYGQSRDFIENARSSITEKLEEAKLKYSLEGRVKTVYSIYKKMFENNKSFEEIFDFYALRIIVDTELECYTVLGIIHDMFRSVPGRFKDYISTPKPNMYRSLHTTVIGRDGIPFEVQIRTWDMHRIAEYGLAAHWKYKTGAESKAEIDQKLQWVSKLIDVEDETNDHDEFMHTLKIDIFHDETFVFTPKGDVITLPQGSTVIDFAYAIHSAVGNKMVGAKINGMIVPIDRVPQNGEIVEILTSNSSKGPSRDWLKIIRTSEARTKIRQWFKKEKQAENILVGRSEIDKEFKKFNRPATEEQREEILSNVSARIGIQSVESLYNTIGYGGISMNKVASKLRDEFERIVKPVASEPVQVDIEALNRQAAPRKTSKSGGVIIDGVDGCMVKFAKCCNPLPGDDLIGFITKGYGVSVHKRDCPNVIANMQKPEYEGRWVSAYWEQGASLMGTSSQYFEAMLRIYAKDNIGLLALITVALADMRVNLVSVSTQKCAGDDIIINLTVNAKNLEHVNSIVSRLKSIDNIEDVTRGFGS
ncbi:MAG: bifunctional (p)ppGpp synthetase/guanosine-3',5'-bis(diphosphate) 3'-pyrophosphohydrolase [Clostridia bacterium]|nr:bifunctional (p)ppGpp synthetase/guanosine-3',5'-bis(diphosphate) 3'-pyrophosphohydrolase [Clostridia bacterium]